MKIVKIEINSKIKETDSEIQNLLEQIDTLTAANKLLIKQNKRLIEKGELSCMMAKATMCQRYALEEAFNGIAAEVLSLAEFLGCDITNMSWMDAVNAIKLFVHKNQKCTCKCATAKSKSKPKTSSKKSKK